MLRAVRARTKRLLIAEFNVDQSLADANVVERERVRWILSRYTVGIQEYIELQDPVIGMSISGKTRVLMCLHEARPRDWLDYIRITQVIGVRAHITQVSSLSWAF